MKNWNELEKICSECKNCSLCEKRKNVVFGMGNKNAEVMFVGEGPGESEDREGLPFVGKSGKLLDCYLDYIDLDRNKNIYIANIVKCRPPQNRDPRPEEQEMCITYLRDQVRLIKPKIIVSLGRISAQRLINPDFRVMREHGVFYNKNGIWMMGTYHPSALLRNPSAKGNALEDFLNLQNKIYEVCENTYNIK